MLKAAAKTAADVTTEQSRNMQAAGPAERFVNGETENGLYRGEEEDSREVRIRDGCYGTHDWYEREKRSNIAVSIAPRNKM